MLKVIALGRYCRGERGQRGVDEDIDRLVAVGAELPEAQLLDAGVEVGATSFDEPVGVEQQCRTGG